MTQPSHDDLIRRIEQSDRASATARETFAGALGRIEATQAHHGVLLTSIDQRVTVLEADDNIRKGRDGVLAAIMRSPAVGWLAAFAAAVWAGLTHFGEAP